MDLMSFFPSRSNQIYRNLLHSWHSSHLIRRKYISTYDMPILFLLSYIGVFRKVNIFICTNIDLELYGKIHIIN